MFGPFAMHVSNHVFCTYIFLFFRAIGDSNCMEGMGAEEKRKKPKIIPGTQPKAQAGRPKRLMLVQATL